MNFSRLSTKTITGLLVLFMGMAYIAGLFVPIMNHNAGHHANIALHMYLTGDYVSLMDQGKDYLDKPHLLFWLAALSYHIFGVTSFAYKMGTFLFTLAGIFATWRLSNLLFDRRTALFSTLILTSAFAFVVSINDVRMDAMLAASIIFATWQLFEYFVRKKTSGLFLGALGLALGFSTKGMVAVIMPVMAVAFYTWQQEGFKNLFTVRWVKAGLLTALFLIPVFYCFYLQFDLHPEKMIRGTSGHSGIQFLLFGQSYERYTGKGWGSRASDPFFIAHTFLWAFLPWCILAYIALFKNLKEIVQARFQLKAAPEVAITATTFFIFLIISFSKFKNPHYVNLLLPYFSILTGRFISQLPEKHLKKTYNFQRVLSLLLIVSSIVASTWFFPVNHVLTGLGALVLLVLIAALLWSRNMEKRSKIVWLSFAASVFCFFLLNFNFYPQLLQYQSGERLAAQVRQAGINPKDLRYAGVDEKNFSLQFHSQAIIPTLSLDSLKKEQKPVYVVADEGRLPALREANISFDTVLKASHYNVSTLQLKFLLPSKRQQQLTNHYVVRLKD